MRQWHGSTVCPLLFDGQYADSESGWAYNRFRYYSPDLGVYGAQDPLGLSPNLGWAQGYVAHPGCMIDLLGLMAHQATGKSLRDQINKLSPNQKGVMGEDISKEMFSGKFDAKNVRSNYTGQITGKGRISDITLTNRDLVESKMVRSQGLNGQIRDGVKEMESSKGTYHLVVGEGTKISGPLQAKIDAPESVIQLHRISDSKMQTYLDGLA